jgi:drug/metabolite transporter (DMT)-like permease
VVVVFAYYIIGLLHSSLNSFLFIMTATITKSSAQSSYITGALWGLFAISIWVGWILLTRYGVTTSLSPFDITALRFACAGLLLAPIVIKRGFGLRLVGFKTLFIICFGAGVPYVLIASGGLQFAPAAHAGALIPGTMPLWAAILAILFLNEKIAGPRRLGKLAIGADICYFCWQLYAGQASLPRCVPQA